MRKLLFLSIFILISSTAFSQVVDTNKSIYSIGAYGVGQFNLHHSNFEDLPGYPCCSPIYESGSGFGLGFGILGEYRLSEVLSLGLTAGYSDLSAVIKQEEMDTFDNSEGTKSDGLIEHTLDANIQAISTSLRLLLELDRSIDVYAGGGISLINNFQIEQYETLIRPTDVTFENDRIVRNESQGEVDGSKSILPFVTAGVRLNLPLTTNSSWELSPIGEFTYYLGNLVDNIDWSLNQLKVGIEVRYNKYHEKVVVVDTIIEEPKAPPKSDIIANISVTDSIYNTTEIDDSKERVIKYQSLLGYIFFEENRAVIPQRYNTEVSESDIVGNSLISNKDTSLTNYYNLLNTVALRLKENPEVEMTIVGCNSNYGLEEGNTELSQQRMNAVYDYFVKEWGLDSNRFKRIARNLPETPSRSDNEFGRAENRRVELIPTDWSILLPKVSKDTKIIKSADIEFKIEPNVTSNLPVNSWEVNVSENSNQIQEYSGEGFPDNSYKIIKSYTENSDFSNIEFSMTGTDSLDTSDSDSYIFDSDKVKKYLENMKIDNRQPTRKEFNLILFGYNIANIPPIAELTLDLVKDNIEKDSKVLKIEGYSDIIGDDDYNLELSEQRAYRVASELNVSKDKAMGMGKVKNTEYNNDYPEGRFYSRSVIVSIGNE